MLFVDVATEEKNPVTSLDVNTCLAADGFVDSFRICCSDFFFWHPDASCLDAAYLAFKVEKVKTVPQIAHAHPDIRYADTLI